MGQKLKFDRFFSKIPELLQLPVFAAGSLVPDPHPVVEAAIPAAAAEAAASAAAGGSAAGTSAVPGPLNGSGALSAAVLA